MAVSRGGVAFWLGCVHNHGRRLPINQCSGTLCQAVDCSWTPKSRPLTSASWALAPPNGLRYLNVKQPTLSHPFHNVSHHWRGDYYEDDLEESLSVCVLLRQGDPDSLHTMLEIPGLSHMKVRELLAQGSHDSFEFSFPLTTVDGRKEDDISMYTKKKSDKMGHGFVISLYEAELYSAPFTHGSTFHYFHWPTTELMPFGGAKSKTQVTGLYAKPVEMPLPHYSTLCAHMERAEGGYTEGDSEEEEKLAVMYERLSVELPGFFFMHHDYTMYSTDMEFVNGLMNTKTRGRMLYQITLSLWRFACLCYYAEARLEVLKLTKHAEDRSIKARWRIRGLPCHALLLRFYRRDKSQLYRSFDAFSTFYIGQDGLIHCHKVEKVMPAHPPVFPSVPSLLAGALVALGVEEHRPALNLLPLLLSSLRQTRN